MTSIKREDMKNQQNVKKMLRLVKTLRYEKNEESLLHSMATSLERGRIKLMDSMDVASPRPSESENPNYNG